MKKPLLLIVLIIISANAGQLSASDKHADYWLDKMMNAVHKLNYDGYFVYLHGDNIESLRTVHTVQDGREIERLYSLNGEAREIFRDEDTVTRILPNEKAISIIPSNAPILSCFPMKLMS